MRNWKRMRIGMAAYCCLSLVATQPVCWAQQGNMLQESAHQFKDIALTGSGTLTGQVVGAEGQPLESVPVRIQQNDMTVVDTVTDQMGQFVVHSMHGGAYEVYVNNQRSNVRLWSANTAPPSAVAGFTHVLGTVQRGQCTADSCTGTCGGTCAACGGHGGGPLGLLMNPWVIGAAVAAAIAIPLAVNNDDDDDAS